MPLSFFFFEKCDLLPLQWIESETHRKIALDFEGHNRCEERLRDFQSNFPFSKYPQFLHSSPDFSIFTIFHMK